MAEQGSYPLNGRTLQNTDTVTGVVTGQTADVPLGVLASFIEALGIPNNSIGDQQLAWGNVLARVVDSVAALEVLNISTYTRAFVTGYYAVGDGGGGPYYYSASTSQSLANGGTILPAAGGTGCWILEVSGTVSVKQFGATGNGTTNDTAAIQSAVNAVAAVVVPAGTYTISNISVPASCLSFLGQSQSGAVFTPLAGRAAGAALITLTNTVNGQYGNFTVNATAVLTDAPVFATGDTGSNIFGIVVTNCGGIALQLNACTDTRMFQNYVQDNGVCAIFAGTCTHAEIFDNHCVSASSDTDSCIQTQSGNNNVIRNNYCKRTTASIGFCIGVQSEDYTQVIGNYVEPNTLEGIATTDCSFVSILGNSVICQTGHHDFGITIDAASAIVNSCMVSGNYIFQPGKAGIDFTSASAAACCIGCSAQGNTIINPCGNQLAGEPHAALLIVGDATNHAVQNTMQNNTVVDFAENVTYIGYEGNGANNIFKDNAPQVNVAGLIAENFITGSGTRAWDMTLTTATATIASGSGALTTASATISYSRRGRFVDIQVSVTITANGTGGTNINIGLPFSCKGVIVGRETAISGKMLQGASASASTLVISFYDATYPGANGASFLLSGTLELI